MMGGERGGQGGGGGRGEGVDVHSTPSGKARVISGTGLQIWFRI